MTNILTDTLPTSINIGNVAYTIDSDFRTCLRVIMAFEDNDLAGIEKQAILINNLYLIMPHDIKEAFSQGIIFLNGGEAGDVEEYSPLRLYSFQKDASLIFSAFRQTHGIDLQATDLHWWTFLALFSDLGQDTTFCQLISLRKRIKTGKASKEERQAAREMASLIDLPEIDNRTLEEREKEAAFMRLVRGG